MANNVKILDTLHHWLDDYLPTAEGKKPNTIESYKDTWRLMMQYMLTKGVNPDEVTYDMLDYNCVMGFLGWVETERNCKVSTRNARLAALCRFAQYSQNRDFESAYIFGKAVCKIPFKKALDSDERAYFSQEEVQIILDLPTPKDNMGIRDHVLLQFMYSSGARAAEVCQVKVGDIHFLSDGKASVLLQGKGGKARRIILVLKKIWNYSYLEGTVVSLYSRLFQL